MGGHHHGHADDHGLIGGWEVWRTSPRLRIVLFALATALVGSVLGLIVLWPSGDGTERAVDAAAEIGLATERVKATVVSSVDAECSYSTVESPQHCRLMTLDVLEGPDAGALVALPEINLQIERSLTSIENEPGDVVVLAYAPTTGTYFYDDQDRSTVLLVLGAVFAIVVLLFGRLRGALALLAMLVTVAILVGFVAPSVLDGNDPVTVAIVAATAIAFVSLTLTHGFSPTTAVALAGTLSALGLTFVLSWIFFGLANFSGFASDGALVLPVLSEDLRVSSLLLGGAMIGALGALDDVTVTQVSTVAELRRHNAAMSSAQLVRSGIAVGRDHIAATVNTLLLAYAGASLPLLLLFAASDQSLATVANSEVIAVEIARTLCGSIGLIAAVPLTTGLAATVLPPAMPDPDAEPDPVEHPPPSWDDFAPEN